VHDLVSEARDQQPDLVTRKGIQRQD
jgi:hypothetical protein